MSCMQFLVGSLPSALRSTRQAQIGQDGKPFPEHSQAEVGRVKTVVACAGFIANRILMPYINEAGTIS